MHARVWFCVYEDAGWDMKRGSFFFRVEFCLKTAQKERRRQKAVFPNRGRQKFHTIRQKTVCDIRMLKMSRLHQRHEACGNKWRRRRQPVPAPWTTMRLQVFLFFFLMQAKEHKGLSNDGVTLVDSAPWILWSGEGGQTLDSRFHLFAHISVFVVCFFCFFMKLLPRKMQVLNFKFNKLVSLRVC